METIEKTKFVNKVLRYLFAIKDQYWIERIYKGKTIDTKYETAKKVVIKESFKERFENE